MTGVDTAFMTNKTNARNLAHTSPDAAREAREQAEAYDSIFATREIVLDDGSVVKVPPHPDLGMLDDDAQEAYEQLLFERDTEYEREPDIYIPEQRLRDPKTGHETGIVQPAETVPGRLKTPYRRRIDDRSVRVTPPWSIQLAKIALGEVEYKRLREGGKGAGDVWKIWSTQGLEAKQRQGRSEADGGAVDLAAISEADSQ